MLVHNTNPKAAQAIRSEGFKVTTGQHYYGSGVYFTVGKGCKFYGSEEIVVEAAVKNTYVYTGDAPLSRIDSSPIGAEIVAALLANPTLTKAQAVTAILIAQGYDSVSAIEDDEILVVFDTALITIR